MNKYMIMQDTEKIQTLEYLKCNVIFKAYNKKSMLWVLFMVQ